MCDCVRDCVRSFHLVKSMLKAVVPIHHCLDSSLWGWVEVLEFRDISLLVGTLLRRVMRVVERVGRHWVFFQKSCRASSHVGHCAFFPSIVVDAQLFQSFPSHKCIHMLDPMAFVALALLP